MGATKIVSEQEVLKWFDEGRTYAWMVEQYRVKYNLEVGQSMFGNFRKRRGLDRRIVRDDKLIPWEVKPEHRYAWPINMLRIEARRRAGGQLTERERENVDGWIRRMKRDGAVLHYEPDTEQGWFDVAPRPGIDTDLIRVPDRPTTKQRNRDDS